LFLVANNPERSLRSAQVRLAKGQPATLIAETGPPAWSAVRYGQATSRLTTAADETFKIYAWDTCLLELLRDPQCERYRLEAAVQYDSLKDENNEAGIYCAYSQHRPDHAQAPYHTFVILRFNTLLSGPEGKRALVRLDLDSFRGPRPFEGRYFSCVLKQFPIPPKESPPAIWHALALEVSPECLRAFWDGQILGEVPGPILLRDTDHLVHPIEGPALPFEPPFRPRQPLGLYVRGGAASFRNIVVEPFPEGPTGKGGKRDGDR
ncbi:MAG TPA: hypothetical protein VJ739_13500, partial [Gemmataceae bacterium]|nr:hypothetical protein [Gemmataceae bacterium]